MMVIVPFFARKSSPDGTQALVWTCASCRQVVRQTPGNFGNQLLRRVLLATAEKQAAGLRLGMVDLVRTTDESSVVGHLGPDLLGDDWDASVAVANLLEFPERTIGEALLDQRNLAGIGTIWRAETLFAQRVNPRTPVGEVADLTALVSKAHELLLRAIDVETWREQRWVYNKAGRPCPRCGTRIACDEYGPTTQERLVWWCPRCQPS